MYITIYFGIKPVFLCDKKHPELDIYFNKTGTFITESCDPESIKQVLLEIKKEAVSSAIVIDKDLQILYENFARFFTVITAAGGLVCNDKNEILLIFRRGKWDLPKGKLDEGETIEACAVREIKEETGLAHVDIRSSLPTTYHTYTESGKDILKKSIWYFMHAPGYQELKPQQEEDITEIKWVPVNELDLYLNNTFPSVKDVLTFYLTGSF